MNKVLSIIIPTYNMEKYLRRCLDSLIIDEEGMKQLEVLVINDGSKDSSSQIAHEYQDKYPDTYRVIDKENGNYGSCINRGLKEATGKYVKVLDADDWFDTNALAIVLRNLCGIDVDLVMTQFNEVTPEGKITKRLSLRKKPSNQEFLFTNYCVNPFESIAMHNIAYKLEILKDINYSQLEGISYTDMQWAFTPIAHVKKAVFYPLYLYQYMRGREGQTMDPVVVKKNFAQFLIMLKGLIADFGNIPLKIDKNTLSYLELILKGQLWKAYQMGLIENAIEIEKLKLFDDYVSANNRVKELSSSIPIANSFRYHFVAYWRKKGRKPFPFYFILFCKLIKQFQMIKGKIINLSFSKKQWMSSQYY